MASGAYTMTYRGATRTHEGDGCDGQTARGSGGAIGG